MVKTTVITDRNGNVACIGRGGHQGAADQDARNQLRKVVERTGHPWNSHQWLRSSENG